MIIQSITLCIIIIAFCLWCIEALQHPGVTETSDGLIVFVLLLLVLTVALQKLFPERQVTNRWDTW